MFTISYKGYYIHGYCNKDECTVSPFENFRDSQVTFKSLRSAKCWITRYLQN